MSKGTKDQGQLHRQYLNATSRVLILDEGEEADLVRRWKEHRNLEARNGLIEAHLRLVPGIARGVADEFGYKPPSGSPQEAWDGYSNVCGELVLAGNEGLLNAASRFDPSRGARFATCARWSIWKACREEAKWLRSPVKYPKGKQTPWSDSLDWPVDDCKQVSPVDDDDQDSFVPLERLTEPENDKLPALGPMVETRADLLENLRERHILRARCLTDSPAKLRVLAEEFGITPVRVRQLEQRAVQSVGALLPQSSMEELAEFYLGNEYPIAVKVGNALQYQIDDRLDKLKLLFPWATQSDRITAHRVADQRRDEASEFNLNRIKAALDEGLTVAEAAEHLRLPSDAVEHLRQLVDWRYSHETRYTLTAAGLEMIEEDDELTDAA